MINMLSVAIFSGLFFASNQLSAGVPFQKCWTQWYDRDDPSGSGDWETLSHLHKENPGKICPKPVAIQAQTLTGLSVAAAGDVIYRSDTTAGFVCRNQDQRNKKCNDYRVRFSCPPSYCNEDVCWTKWYDRDNPSGTGDWEILSYLNKENPGMICPKPVAIQAQTLTGLSVAAAGDVIYRSDTTAGFVCRNQDQHNKKCNDYRVRFSCPPSYCDEDVCWTKWYDRDDPSGTGDWEILSHLHKENPGKICPKPAAIQAQTLTGLSVAAVGDVIYRRDTTTGFVCRNQDQHNKKCNDYRVRFSCPPSYCDKDVCWTKWYDRDNPSGTGDWEDLSDLHKENPGKICPKPAAIQAQTLTGLSVAAAGDVIYRSDTTTGFVCRNQDQHNKKCNDYRVRFSCPPSYCDKDVCWTKWYDRDDPSGSGDWEILSYLHKENPGKICPKPAAIQAQTLTGLSVAAAGDVIYRSDTTAGFVCRNQDQHNKKCNDYRVRFSCPPSYCDKDVCWTQWFDRDDPSGSGDWEILSYLNKEHPGMICPKPAAIQAQTLTGLSVAAAGDVIYRSDTTTGFVCRNQDQHNKKCNDYRVRFSCPPSYCDKDVCWTQWFDRDDPSGSGDWEILSHLHKEHPGKICPKPAAIQAQTLTGLSVAAAGDVIYRSDTTTGFVCRNQDQHNKMCNDYRVRFSCPASYCDKYAPVQPRDLFAATRTSIVDASTTKSGLVARS
ncbi:uncharacterized protein LOC117727655 isoform X2 [Cyclopterus lumpus]|uniref:uncharacterized protein LOC117727655 isoform X2 n=1 Tax=Cyclopterus lumpus TaxID=8103 RepID=UPI001485E009|nr:uncharacterized protein LOC117727655 isoform X2 [Cyclopterus lumpus]